MLAGAGGVMAKTIQVWWQDDDGKKPPELREIPVLFSHGPWAVHLSLNDKSPGFAVTHAPSGGYVWPTETGPAPLPQALSVAKKLAEIWSSDEPFTESAVTRILGVVGYAPRGHSRGSIPREVAEQWLPKLS